MLGYAGKSLSLTKAQPINQKLHRSYSVNNIIGAFVYA